MFVYGLLRFDNLSPGGDHHRIIPSHWIATTGVGPPLHGVEVYRPEPVAFFAVHRLDFIKPRRSEPNHCTGGPTLTPLPHFWQMNASMTVKPRNTFVAPQCGQRALHISTDASSINLLPARWRGTVSTTEPQALHLISTISPRSTTIRQPSQSAPVASS